MTLKAFTITQNDNNCLRRINGEKGGRGKCGESKFNGSLLKERYKDLPFRMISSFKLFLINLFNNLNLKKYSLHLNDS